MLVVVAFLTNHAVITVSLFLKFHNSLHILQHILQVVNTCILFLDEVAAKFRSLSTLRFISDLLLWILLPPIFFQS